MSQGHEKLCFISKYQIHTLLFVCMYTLDGLVNELVSFVKFLLAQKKIRWGKRFI